MKMRNRILLAVCLLSLLTLHVAEGGQTTFTLYKDYIVPVPAENYVVFCARAFGPDKYVVLDLKQKEARIYSPYQEKGLLYTHRMTDAEYEKATTLLTSDQMQNIPERNDKLALDAFEFSAHGIVKGKTLKFHHILPDNKAVLDLYDLYKHFRDTIPR